VASKFLSGKIKGPPPAKGTRKDDPNDTVLHENRREMRGLQVVSSFLNNTDTRRGNYLDVYVGDEGKGHLEHYLLDFGISMGSLNDKTKPSRYGHENFFDIPIVFKSLATLGLWVKPWEKEKPVTFKSVGTFEADVYEPDKWRPHYPNPVFRNRTDQDAFWAAKIITSFSDEEFRAMAETGQYSEPGAADYVAQTLSRRRDKVGKTYFSTKRINPLDDFQTKSTGQNQETLRWKDLGVDRGYAEASNTVYRYSFSVMLPGKPDAPTSPAPWKETRTPEVAFSRASLLGPDPAAGTVLVVILETTHNRGKSWSPPLYVYLSGEPRARGLQIAGLRREI